MMSSTVLQSMVVCCESPGCLVTTEEARSDRPVFILRPRHPPATSGHGTVQMPGMINIPVGFSLGFNNQYSTQKLLLPSARIGSFIHVVVMFTYSLQNIDKTSSQSELSAGVASSDDLDQFLVVFR